MRGRLDEHILESKVLCGNPLGDPHVRPLWVYVPPAGVASPDRPLPAIYLIQGMTGQLDMWRNRGAFAPTVVERIDALFAGDDAPSPALVVLVDCWTSYGGSQFLDSPGTGRYHTFLCDEVVPFVDRSYATRADRDHRGITGKSSGGYGAMVTPLLRPELFSALASHAGDALFELCYLTEFGPCARALRDQYDGSFDRFWQDFRGRQPMARASDAQLVNQYAMAACYSAGDDGTVRLPFDVATGQLVREVWEQWLAWDPVRMIPQRADAARSLRAVYLDAGRSDEYYLDLGAAAARQRFAEAGVRDIAFELFDGRHGGIDHRYPGAIRFLAERLGS